MDERDVQNQLEIIGTVKSLIFQNQENGYSVLQASVKGFREAVRYEATPPIRWFAHIHTTLE